jgi:hypothetical protein
LEITTPHKKDDVTRNLPDARTEDEKNIVFDWGFKEEDNE